MNRISNSAAALMATVLFAGGPAAGAVLATPAGMGLVYFEAEAFAATAAARVTFVDIWQEEEYVKFEGGGARAEIIYAVADERDSIVLDFRLTLKGSIESWQANAADGLSWGGRGAVHTAIGKLDYQLYSQRGQHCVGFLNEWDYRAGDPELRPAKAIFGYYCGLTNAQPTESRIAELLSGIRIDGIDRLDYRFTPRLSLARTAGGAVPTTGNLGFPYAMADMFVDADGERSN